MNIWFKRSLCVCMLSVFIWNSSLIASADPAVTNESKRMTLNGKTFQVKVVSVNISDPMIEVKPVIEAKGIGYDESFSSIIQREGAVAAVNGTFFNAYEKAAHIRYPNGTLLSAGELIHSGENQTFVISADRVPDINFIKASISVTVKNGQDSYIFKPWGINKYYGANVDDQVVWYTPAFGSIIDFPRGSKVVIQQGKITQITDSAVQVPVDGYVAFIGHSQNNKTYLLPNLKVGSEVTTKLNIVNEQGEQMEAGRLLVGIGVGPKLVSEGKVDLNHSRDGFTDPKITQLSAARSFLGIDAKHQLVMGTVNNATMAETAQIAVNLGLLEAMNMDGGASSGLYADGMMLATPGRALSNALVVRRLQQPQVQIVINGHFIWNFKGFIEQNITMVPLRPFITELNAEFAWDGDKNAATIAYNDVQLTIQAGESNVYVNGEQMTLDVPPVIINGRMYAPLRFVAEKLNAKVSWNAALYRANIDIK